MKPGFGAGLVKKKKRAVLALKDKLSNTLGTLLCHFLHLKTGTVILKFYHVFALSQSPT